MYTQLKDLPGKQDPQEELLKDFSIEQPKKGIFKLYYFVLFFYCFPFINLLLFAVTGKLTFWLVFLLSPIPCSLIGIALGIWGWIMAYKYKSTRNKVLAFLTVFLGVGGIVLGILALMLIAAVVG